MRKIFFTALSLFVCCTFLAGAEKLDMKKLEGAFSKKGQWCFFTTEKSKTNRITYVDKNAYKICREGDLFKKILYKDKYYAMDLNKNIYRPHWQMEQNFNSHLIPAPKYIKSLNSKLKSSKKSIKELKQKISKYEDNLKYSKEKYEKLSSLKKYGAGRRYGSKINARQKYHKEKIKTYEDSIEDSTKNLKYLEKQFAAMEAAKSKTIALYKKYLKTGKPR